MSTVKPEPIFAVLDLETEGLDPKKHRILEVAALHIDFKTLEIKNRFQLVPGVTREYLEKESPMDAYVRDMHTKSGLLEQASSVPSISVEQVDRTLSAWFAVALRAGEKQIVLCGNSIGQFDRVFLQEQLPVSFSYLSHRVVDTSSIHALRKQWCAAEEQKPAHRAMDDCLMSLDTLKWAQVALQKGAPTPPQDLFGHLARELRNIAERPFSLVMLGELERMASAAREVLRAQTPKKRIAQAAIDAEFADEEPLGISEAINPVPVTALGSPAETFGSAAIRELVSGMNKTDVAVEAKRLMEAIGIAQQHGQRKVEKELQSRLDELLGISTSNVDGFATNPVANPLEA